MDSYYIDSHAHIYLDQFTDNVDEIINRSLDNKVNKILMPNINLDTVSKMLNLSGKYKGICYPMLGLHPCYIENEFENEITKILEYKSSETIAIGEIGLDFFRGRKNIKNQIRALEIQCEYALSQKLPIVIHTRNSIDETISIVSRYSKKGLTGVFHCFSGNLNQAYNIINMGFKIGVGGILTFKNSNIKNVISKIEIKHLILETDSPYLSPEPLRGKVNEPANIIFISEKLSEILSVPIEIVSQVTSENVKNLFDLQSN
tara:strand:- start:196 stop:975 length:780 start_codon:yes stop_codon:yes gene_type:complete